MTDYTGGLYALSLDRIGSSRRFLGVSDDLCPEFGSLGCSTCDLAAWIPEPGPPFACDLQCGRCALQRRCPCGNADLRQRLRAKVGGDGL